MTFTAAMFTGFIIVLVSCAICAVILGVVGLTIDHPVVLAISLFLFLWLLVTLSIYAKG